MQRYLTLCCLMSLLQACASSQVVVTERVCPSKTLLQNRPIPEWTGRTVGDLMSWSLEAAEIIKAHNADKEAASRFCE